jgi:hypothetical protein
MRPRSAIRGRKTEEQNMASKRIDRVAQRPDPAMWGEDEIMNLGEAARLHWPNRQPVGEGTLRRAVRDGRLAVSILAGKYFVTRRALAALSTCEPLRVRDPEEDDESGGGGRGYLADLAAIERMGRK